MQSTTTFLNADEYELCSIASSNETADDMPGPGRLLGNLYDDAGRRLENGLGRVAIQMGRRPRAGDNQIVTTRLRPRRHHMNAVSKFSAPD